MLVWIITVDYDGIEVEYTPDRLKQLDLAYAVTVHKSQGCEYDSVIYPTSLVQGMMLQRNLLYTAVTRAKRNVLMFGWRMYTDGNVLSIVSDPLNVNDKAIIYNFGGSMGYKIVFEYDENGNAFMNTYDSKGNLISSSPFDPGVDENSGGGEAPPSIPFGNSGAPQTELPEEEDALPPGWSV